MRMRYGNVMRGRQMQWSLFYLGVLKRFWVILLACKEAVGEDMGLKTVGILRKWWYNYA